MNTNAIAVTAITTATILNSVGVAMLSRSIVKVVGIIVVTVDVSIVVSVIVDVAVVVFLWLM